MVNKLLLERDFRLYQMLLFCLEKGRKVHGTRPHFHLGIRAPKSANSKPTLVRCCLHNFAASQTSLHNRQQLSVPPNSKSSLNSHLPRGILFPALLHSIPSAC